MGRNNEFSLGHGAPVYTGTQGLAGSPFMGDAYTWATYALTERSGEDTADEPGRKWGKNVALVPIHQLVAYREYNRETDPKYSHEDSQATIESIADDLRRGGIDALKSPINMDYDHNAKWGYVGEGNHRIAAALRAGLTHLPVAIGGKHDLQALKDQGVGAPLHLDNRIVERGGYYPASLHPGNFQEFEGAR